MKSTPLSTAHFILNYTAEVTEYGPSDLKSSKYQYLVHESLGPIFSSKKDSRASGGTNFWQSSDVMKYFHEDYQ